MTCPKCNKDKPETEFPRYRSGNGKIYRRNSCNECLSALGVKRMREWRAKKDPIEESIKIACRNLKLDFSVVWPYYQSHNGHCEICKEKPTKNRLVLDHCHASGKFRGLLCTNCNRAIGMLKESRHNLIGAIAYLDIHE